MPSIQLPNGRIITVENVTPERAAAVARLVFEREHPDEFSTWAQQQEAGGIGGSISRGIQEEQGRLYGAAEAVGQFTGIGPLERFGREGRLRNVVEAEEAMPGAQQRAFETGRGAAGILEPAIQAVGGALPSSALPLAGTIIGGLLGGPVGAVAGGAAGAFAPLLGGNIERQAQQSVQEGGPDQAPSPGTAIAAAVPQALISGILDRFMLRMSGIAGVPAEEVGRALLPRIATGIGVGAVTEIPEEVLQTAIERAQAGLPVLDDAALAEYGQAAAGGAVGGGALGGTFAGAFGRRPGARPSTAEEPGAPPAEEAAPSEPTPPAGPAPLVGEQPAPFQSFEEASDYLAANPAPSSLTTPEAQTAWASARRLAEWEDSVTAARPVALSEFTGTTPELEPQGNDVFLNNIVQAAASEQLNLTKFTPQNVATLAFQQRGITDTKPSKEEVAAVSQRLDSLVSANLLDKTSDNTYRISTRSTLAQPEPTAAAAPAPEVPAAPAPTPAPESAAPVAPAPTPSPVETTDAPEFKQARQTLETIAQTGNPAPAPSPQDTAIADLWRAYSTASGPLTASPAVSAARLLANQQGRPLTFKEFETIATTLAATPVSPEVATAMQQAASAIPVPQAPQATPAQAPQAPQAQPAPRAQAMAMAPSPTIRAGTPAPAATPPAPPSPPSPPAAPSPASPATPPPATPVPPSPPSPPGPPPPPTGPTPRPTPPPAARPAGPPKTFFKGLSKIFSSPLSGVMSDNPELHPLRDATLASLDYFNEADAQLLSSPVKHNKLKTRESVVRVVRAWYDASKNRTAPNTSGMSADEIEALNDLIAGVQRGLDWYIEGKVYDYFDPGAAVNPADKARLEAFWQRNTGKHLWEIPAAELQAASPAGYREYQRLNAMRNPYKMPSVTTGTHFVAAYKRGPTGMRQGPPVAMYIYTPPGTIASKLGAENPETVALAELRREFPNSATHYIMSGGRELTADQDASKISRDAGAISNFLNGLMSLPSVANSPQAREELARLHRTLDKASVESILRPDLGILRPITPLNEDSYVKDMLPRYLVGIAKLAARSATQGRFERAIQNLSDADRRYAQQHRDYYTTPTEAFSTVRAVTYFTLLGGAPDSGLINLLQVPQIVAPMLFRDGGPTAYTYFPKIYGTLIKSAYTATRKQQNVVDVLKNNLTDPGEKAAYTRALEIGNLQPMYTNESRGQFSADTLRNLGLKNPVKKAEALNKLVHIFSIFQQQSEQINRAVSFLAAYRMARDNPQVLALASRLDNATYNTPYDYAIAKTNQTNFITTKEDRALYQRFTPAAEPVTQFTSFPMKTTELLIRQATLGLRGVKNLDPELAKAGAMGFFGMVAPIVALGGVFALPFAESLKEALEALIKLAWGTTANLEVELRRALGGGYLAQVASRGFPHVHNYASLNRRLALDPFPFTDLTSGNIFSIIGPVGSIPEAAGKFFSYLSKGDYVNAVASAPFMPRAVGNVIRAADIQFGSGEIRSQQGSVLITADQLRRFESEMGMSVAARTAFGFQPPAVVEAREWIARQQELDRLNTEATQRFNNRVAEQLTSAYRAQAAGRHEEANRLYREAERIMTEQGERNARYIEAGQTEYALNFNMAAIRQRAQQDFEGRSSEQVSMRGLPRNVRERAQEELGMMNPAARTIVSGSQ